MNSVNVRLMTITVAVDDNPQLVAELETLVAERLLCRKAIGECLQIAATGRIDRALQALRRACPDAETAEVAAGETAVPS